MSAESSPYSLTAALEHYGNPRLLEFIRVSERSISEETFFKENRPRFAENGPLAPPADAFATRMWHLGWKKLLEEFAQRIVKGDLHITGTMIRPEARTEAEVIPAAWASEMTLFVTTNAINVVGRRFVGVQARSGPAPKHAPPARPFRRDADGKITFSPEEAIELSDEALLLLLEEHGRRVVEAGAYPLLQPSRVSFGAVLARRMEWRAKDGQLASTLTAECAALVEWLGTKIEHHQIPTARGIEDPLRDLYRQLKAGSTRRIA